MGDRQHGNDRRADTTARTDGVAVAGARHGDHRTDAAAVYRLAVAGWPADVVKRRAVYHSVAGAFYSAAAVDRAVDDHVGDRIDALLVTDLADRKSTRL